LILKKISLTLIKTPIKENTMLFRLLSYSALLYIITLLLPEAKFDFFEAVTGETTLTNIQLISILTIIISVELFINFTKVGKVSSIYFYKSLTLIRVFLVISLISTTVVARSEHIGSISKKINETCQNDSLKSVCETGKGVVDNLIHQAGMFF
jgi:hypothetical protein